MIRPAIVVLGLALGPIGAGAQSVDTVDVGGHGLEVMVSGTGLPVVVFEAGLGSDRTTWDAVLPMVAEFTTAVAYSRAGYPGSDVGPEPRLPAQINAELRKMLEELALPPPYVLVGHSLGGLFVRSFYYSFPDEVGGLVLVDGSHERQFKTWQDLDSSWDPWAPNSGFLRWAAARGAGPRGEAAAFLEVQKRGTLPNSRPLTDLPVYVLTADQPDPADTTVSNTEAGRRVWRNLHAELFDGVNQGAHIVTQLSNHNIHLTEPSLVVWAVRRVVTAMRLSGR